VGVGAIPRDRRQGGVAIKIDLAAAYREIDTALRRYGRSCSYVLRVSAWNHVGQGLFVDHEICLVGLPGPVAVKRFEAQTLPAVLQKLHDYLNDTTDLMNDLTEVILPKTGAA
jgi:hypothetical protein